MSMCVSMCVSVCVCVCALRGPLRGGLAGRPEEGGVPHPESGPDLLISSSLGSHVNRAHAP